MPTLSRDQASCYVSAHSLIPLARAATGIILVATKTKNCRDKTFVAASILLSRKTDVFCRDKHVFVATKMMLVAALASNNLPKKKMWKTGKKGSETVPQLMFPISLSTGSFVPSLTPSRLRPGFGPYIVPL